MAKDVIISNFVSPEMTFVPISDKELPKTISFKLVQPKNVLIIDNHLFIR